MAICFLPLCLIHVFKGGEINLMKFNFVEKGGVNWEKGVQTLSACDQSVAICHDMGMI